SSGQGCRLHPRAGGRPRDRRSRRRRGAAGRSPARLQYDVAGRPRPRRREVNIDVTTSAAAPVLPLWRQPQAWARTADVVAVLIALALPWSTSLVGIFVVVWVIAVLPTLDPAAFA